MFVGLASKALPYYYSSHKPHVAKTVSIPISQSGQYTLLQTGKSFQGDTLHIPTCILCSNLAIHKFKLQACIPISISTFSNTDLNDTSFSL